MVNKLNRQIRRKNRISYNLKVTNINNRQLVRVLAIRTGNNITVQLIDINGDTKAVFASNQKEFKAKANKEQKPYNQKGAFLVGQMMGEYMLANEINEFIFDRGGYQYHGRIKQLCDGINSIIKKENK